MSVQWAVVGAFTFALVGGFVGLLVGLSVHPAAAWFAMFEMAVPASIIGFVAGLVCGLIVEGVRKRRRRVSTI